MKLKEAIRRDTKANASIFAMVGENIFLNTPETAPENAYITFSIQKTPNAITQKTTVRFVCFAKDLGELETLCDLLIENFDGKTNSVGTNLYQTFFSSQKDVEEKLANGFWASFVFFEFFETR